MLSNQRTDVLFVMLAALTISLPTGAFAQTRSEDLNTSELQVDAVEPQIALPEVKRKSNPSLRVHTISLGQRKQSRDGLVRLAQEAVDTTSRRLLSSSQHTPWQMMHALLGLRQEFQILHEGQEVNGLNWIAQGQVFNDEHWFEKTEYGGRAHPYSVPYAFEGHANQTLAVLSMCGLEIDHEFGTADGPITIGDMIEHAKATCDTKRDEPTWTLWALSRYLPPDAVWRNEQGEVYSIERLVSDQTARPLKGAACGGTHGLFALAHARNVYLREGKPLRGVWLQAENKLRYYINTARRLQNSNGSLSSNYLRGRQYNPDFNKRMASAGHVLEFLMLALPQAELDQRWVRRAVEATARDLLNNRKEYVKCSPLYHSVNALNIYLDRVNPREEVPMTAEEKSSRTAMINRDNRVSAQGISRSKTLKKPAAETAKAANEEDTPAKISEADPADEQDGKKPLPTVTETEKTAAAEKAKEDDRDADATQSEQLPRMETDRQEKSPRIDQRTIDALIQKQLKELEDDADGRWVATKPHPPVVQDEADEPLPLMPVEAYSKLKPVEESADSGSEPDTPVADGPSVKQKENVGNQSTEPKPLPPNKLAPLMAKDEAKSVTDEAAIAADNSKIEDSKSVSTAPELIENGESESIATNRLMLPGRLHVGERGSNPFSVERPVSRTPLRIPMTSVSESRTLAREQAEESADKQDDPSRDEKATEFPTVPAGINDGFLDPNLDPEEWVSRFEIESREIYACRDQIVKAVGLTVGQSIADVGAGTGLFTGLFSKAVGETGTVYAIDISPRLIAHLEKRVVDEKLSNVQVVRNNATSTQLVTKKVDRAFVCDTYHHFERPDAMLKSIHQALNEGGELVVIDFERIPGESRDWVIGHVRAGKDTFREEIEASGFEFVKEVKIDGFKENYLLVFRRK